MYFNSLEFGLFLPIVFFLYWFVFNRNLKTQNLFLLASSYFFYGWWDWKFLSLIIFSSLVDFTVGIGFLRTEKATRRKLLLATSIFVNIGLLCYFKYFNFFTDSFCNAFRLLGITFNPKSLSIILPVGISFYTFQTLSYSIDAYRKKIEPTRDFIAFFTYVSFFPQLVAGPIERARNLLPQFIKRRQFEYCQGADGLKQILWGLFKKVVIADRCAIFVNDIFQNYDQYSGPLLAFGVILFAFQIYCDFSGYSDIAIGTAKLFGISLMTNFKYPYFARDIAEFWRRWHISLSTWFRDYIYIPIGGSRGSKWVIVRNVLIIFLISGLWHGGNWTFIIWGFLNAVYFIPLILRKKNRVHLEIVANDRNFPTIKEVGQILVTFSLTSFGWIFFRATDLNHAINYIAGFKNDFGALLLISFWKPLLSIIILLVVFVSIEWIQRKKEHALQIYNSSTFFRWSAYLSFCLIILFSLKFHDVAEFIYFQF